MFQRKKKDKIEIENSIKNVCILNRKLIMEKKGSKLIMDGNVAMQFHF